MTHDCASAKPRFLTRLFISLFAVAVGLLAPTASVAHPLGNFSISHYSGIRVEKTGSAQESGGGCILGGFLENDHFSPS